MGVVAAAGFALGVSSGLRLAGASRAIIILSMIPVALTLRSSFERGMRPARLINLILGFEPMDDRDPRPVPGD